MKTKWRYYRWVSNGRAYYHFIIQPRKGQIYERIARERKKDENKECNSSR